MSSVSITESKCALSRGIITLKDIRSQQSGIRCLAEKAAVIEISFDLQEDKIPAGGRAATRQELVPLATAGLGGRARGIAPHSHLRETGGGLILP